MGDLRVRPDDRRLDDPGPAPGKSGMPSGPQQPRDRARRRRTVPGWEGGEARAQDTIILSVEDLNLARETIALAQKDAAAARDADNPAAEPAAREPRATAGDAPPSRPGDQPAPASQGPASQDPAPQDPAPQDPARKDPAEPDPAGQQLAGAGAAVAARPQRQPAVTPATRRGPAPAAEPRPVPSWGAVLVTTVQLWVQRRLHRPSGARTATTPSVAGSRPAIGSGPAAGSRPDGGSRRSTRWRLTLVLVVAAALFAAGAVTVALIRGAGSPTAKGSPGQAGTGQPASAAALRAAASARAKAAAWITSQVAASAIVACDPLMCADLQHAGLSAGRLLVLGTGTAGPTGSDVIVATAAVRQEFGTRLTSVFAPVTLASFGSGSAQASIRVVAPDGSAAYMSGLHADMAARASAGSQLLRNPRIRESAAVRQALSTGQVDDRVLTVLAALATMHTVDVLAVGTPAAGASTGMPLRSADITPGAPMPRPLNRPNTVGSLERFLQDQQAPFLPAGITAIRLDGRAALRIQFAAPSPLGLLGKN
jgi:hypothetical protein